MIPIELDNFELFSRERHEYDDSDEEGTTGHKKDEELQKEIRKQFHLRKSGNSGKDDDKAEEEIRSKTSLVRAAASTRIKVNGLTLKVCNLSFHYFSLPQRRHHCQINVLNADFVLEILFAILVHE